MKKRYIAPCVSEYIVDMHQSILAVSDTRINISDDTADSYDSKENSDWKIWNCDEEI